MLIPFANFCDAQGGRGIVAHDHDGVFSARLLASRESLKVTGASKSTQGGQGVELQVGARRGSRPGASRAIASTVWVGMPTEVSRICTTMVLVPRAVNHKSIPASGEYTESNIPTIGW